MILFVKHVEQGAHKTIWDFEYLNTLTFWLLSCCQRGRGTFQDVISLSAPSQFCGISSDIDRYVSKSMCTGLCFIHPVMILLNIAG